MLNSKLKNPNYVAIIIFIITFIFGFSSIFIDNYSQGSLKINLIQLIIILLIKFLIMVLLYYKMIKK
mgnify:CR=1 FL=1